MAKFIITTIEKQRVCFRYIHKWRPSRMKKSKILLPVTASGEIDYNFMESFIQKLENTKLDEYKEYAKKRVNEILFSKKIENIKLEKKEWKVFKIKDLFTSVQRGKRLTKENQIAGKVPYISSSAMNNGVDNYISNENKVRRFSNCLSLANSGSVGSCFYEPFEFVASDHITHLKNEDRNKYSYLFEATMLNRLSEKYNFNREINDDRISTEVIILPTTPAGEPDYLYMESYIKEIMLRKYNEYLNYKKVDSDAYQNHREEYLMVAENEGLA